MELIRNLRNISFVLFFLTGIAFAISRLFMLNGYFLSRSAFIVKYSFLPFVLLGFIYLWTSLNLDKERALAGKIFLAVIFLLIFFGIGFLYLSSPDKI